MIKKNFKTSFKRNIKFIKGNILNYDQVLKATKKQDVIYNFAGISDIGEAMSQPILTTKVNILGSIHTLEAAVKNKVKRYIFASSIYVLSRQGGFTNQAKNLSKVS